MTPIAERPVLGFAAVAECHLLRGFQGKFHGTRMVLSVGTVTEGGVPALSAGAPVVLTGIEFGHEGMLCRHDLLLFH